MKLLAKLTTLARALVSERKAHSDVSSSSGRPVSPSMPGLKQKETPLPLDTLEEARVADLLRDQLGANKEKGE